MRIGTNLKYTKAYNYRTVLETIRLHGPLSRADVARSTALTAQTVSNIVKELIGADLVAEGEKRQEGRGAPSTTLLVNPDSAFSVGLDLDRDHLTGVLVDFSGAMRRRLHVELDFPTPDEALGLMAETTERLLAQQGAPRESILGVGVGFPGPLDISRGSVVTNVVNPRRFPGWENVAVVDTLHERLALPIMLENNATAAAVGERWYGAGQHIDTFFYVFFGAGLGGGIIINGYPFDGHSGNAGELGYLPALNGDMANGGARHAGEYFHLSQLYETLRAHGHDVATPDALAALHEHGNPQLQAWVEATAERLAPLVLAVEYLIDPEAIFFGGRLPSAVIRAIMKRVGEALPALRIEGKTAMPDLLEATAGMSAAALGAATLPLYEVFSPTPRVLLKQEANGDRSPGAPALLAGR